jgi:hypothetical protein
VLAETAEISLERAQDDPGRKDRSVAGEVNTVWRGELLIGWATQAQRTVQRRSSEALAAQDL